MKKIGKQVLSLMLVLILCLSVLPGMGAQAAGNAMGLDAVKALLNKVELHPQRTGYAEMDKLLEDILAPYAESDPYTQIKAMYDWSVYNIVYSWAGYSQDYAPAYDKFTLRYRLTYEAGLPEAIPEEMIHRAYHAMTAKTGVCYDWGALFAIMARYVGVESYVHTGILRINSWTGHHGWTTLRIDGQDYIFDAQQDNRLLESDGTVSYAYFGIPKSAWYDYTPETKVNDARDAGFLPITAERERVAEVKVQASASGEVEGAGTYHWGEEVTLTAVGEHPFVGWYNTKGELLSTDPKYAFVPEAYVTLYALFDGDYFVDVSRKDWFFEDMSQAVDRGLIYGETSCTFLPEGNMTRAQLAAVLARAAGADTEAAAAAPFQDVNQTQWYAASVNWAYENGVVYGETPTKFNPSGKVTREQAAAMIMRYLEGQGVSLEANEAGTAFADAASISPYAAESIAKAGAAGILAGYPDGTFRPGRTVTRAEGTSFLMRAVRLAA